MLGRCNLYNQFGNHNLVKLIHNSAPFLGICNPEQIFINYDQFRRFSEQNVYNPEQNANRIIYSISKLQSK